MPLAPQSEYTLAELSEEIGRRVAAAGLAPLDGRVSAVPDGRTLRYYTSVGLLDRPLEVRDRQARYGERHVLQALAIKALQAGGQSLAAIQAALSGLGDDELAEVATSGARRRTAVSRFWAAAPVSGTDPDHGQVEDADAHMAATSPTSSRRSATGAPAPPAPVAAGKPDDTRRPATRAAARSDQPGRDPAGSSLPPQAHLHTTVRLATGVTLVLDGSWSARRVRSVLAALEPCLDAVTAMAVDPNDPLNGPTGPDIEEHA